jgi:hypothetical protein
MLHVSSKHSDNGRTLAAETNKRGRQDEMIADIGEDTTAQHEHKSRYPKTDVYISALPSMDALHATMPNAKKEARRGGRTHNLEIPCNRVD